MPVFLQQPKLSRCNPRKVIGVQHCHWNLEYHMIALHCNYSLYLCVSSVSLPATLLAAPWYTWGATRLLTCCSSADIALSLPLVGKEAFTWGRWIARSDAFGDPEYPSSSDLHVARMAINNGGILGNRAVQTTMVFTCFSMWLVCSIMLALVTLKPSIIIHLCRSSRLRSHILSLSFWWWRKPEHLQEHACSAVAELGFWLAAEICSCWGQRPRSCHFSQLETMLRDKLRLSSWDCFHLVLWIFV